MLAITGFPRSRREAPLPRRDGTTANQLRARHGDACRGKIFEGRRDDIALNIVSEANAASKGCPRTERAGSETARVHFVAWRCLQHAQVRYADGEPLQQQALRFKTARRRAFSWRGRFRPRRAPAATPAGACASACRAGRMAYASRSGGWCRRWRRDRSIPGSRGPRQ